MCQAKDAVAERSMRSRSILILYSPTPTQPRAPLVTDGIAMLPLLLEACLALATIMIGYLLSLSRKSIDGAAAPAKTWAATTVLQQSARTAMPGPRERAAARIEGAELGR